jgi:hypothetical protein
MDQKTRARARQKSSGRKKAMPKKIKADAIKAAASASNLRSLDYMLSVMRDPRASFKLRIAMATKALPYCHARLKECVKPPPPAPDVPLPAGTRSDKD